MGLKLVTLAVNSDKIELYSAVDREGHESIGDDAGLLAGLGKINCPLTDKFEGKPDVIVDFSLPAGAQKAIEWAKTSKTALVIGTTGIDEQLSSSIDEAAKVIPIVQATNMSTGMNLLFSMVGKIAEALGEDYDIEITEAHHRFKKDAPSGTALTLAENICKQTGRNYPDDLVHGREGKDCPRRQGSIGMHAVRGGDIVGEHSVMYSTLGETVTISHSAHSRETFVRGALRAAVWIAGKPPRRYTMVDVLGQ
jgi:4-hydroxy-tetrahydrodipicolinate reductase